MTATITNKVNTHDAESDVKRHANALSHATYSIVRPDGWNDVLCADCTSVEDVQQTNEIRLVWDAVSGDFRIQVLSDGESWTIGYPVKNYNKAVGTFAVLAS
jgi:hypothetical protein